MNMDPGVTLVEHGKSIRIGEPYQLPGKLKLDEYRKLQNPNIQQV